MIADDLSLAELSRGLRQGDVSAHEVVKAYFARIDEREPVISAWAHLDRDKTFATADGLDSLRLRGGSAGPLHGIPFGVKDIFDTADFPTEWGSPLYRGRRARRNAGLVTQLGRLGAAPLGKTHTTGFAYFDPAPTRNPHNPEHTPGGSSSGSAAAVAAGMVPFALGSQTMGSVLRPASFCGVVGFKPSFGRLSLNGVLPFAPSLDHAGLFTRTVEDMAFLWRALPWRSARPGGESPRLAAPPWPPGGEVELVMAEAFEACLSKLEESGIAVERVALPDSFAAAPEATLTVLAFEAAQVHRERHSEHGNRIGAKLTELVERGLKVDEPTYRTAATAIHKAGEDFEAWCTQHPVTATPAALGPAPEGLESTGDPRGNAPWTSLGVPALALPFGETADGLPLGLQLSAARGEEGAVLRAGLDCERILGPFSVLGSN